MVGIALGLSAGALFAVGAVLVRIGQRHRAEDDGLLMTVLVNVVVLGVIAMTTDAPPWNWAGVVGILIGGVLGSVVGRHASLRAVRLIGPTRFGAFMTGSPVVAAGAGWLVLREGIGLFDALGAVLILSGLLTLVRSRSNPTAITEGGPSEVDVKSRRIGFVWAALAPTFFGLSFVIKKWGLQSFPSLLIGAFLGSLAALVVILALDFFRSRLNQRLAENLQQIPWWFVAAGIAMSGALLSQFNAFSHLPAWMVGVLQGTQGLWALLLGWLFLRQEEQLSSTVIVSAVLVMGGVVVIGLP